MNPVQRTRDVQNIESSILKFAVFDGVATLMLGLGLYGKLVAEGNAFHPFLNDPRNVNTLIMIGAIGMAFCGFKLFTLILKKAKLKKPAEA